MIFGLLIFVVLLVLTCIQICRWSYKNGWTEATRVAERRIPAAPLTLVSPVERPGMPKLIEPDPQEKPVSGHFVFQKNVEAIRRKKAGHHSKRQPRKAGRFVKSK